MIYAITSKTRRALAPLALAFVLLLAALPAAADDFLRGSFGLRSYDRWDGGYVGMDYGWSEMSADFGDSASNQIGYILRDSTLENEGHVSEWTSVPKGRGRGAIWGGYVGYNWQVDRMVVGAEFAYHKGNVTATGSDHLARVFNTSDGYVNSVTLDTSGSIQLKDYFTVRARAGYAMGQFMPYGGVGLSVARVSYTTSSTVRVTAPAQGGNPAVDFGPQTVSDHKDNAVAYGVNLALGMDITLMPNLFLRGELEHVIYMPVGDIRFQTTTVRAGLGLKF